MRGRGAHEAAGEKDVRLGGGVTTNRGFLDAGPVDTPHAAGRPPGGARERPAAVGLAGRPA